MAKIRMAQVAGLPVRTLRRMVGIPAHRPSAFNACIGAQLKRIQGAFTSAVRSCAGRRA